MFPQNVFPDTAEINAQGQLIIGGCNTLELAEQYGTPVYIFDEATLRNRCRSYQQEFGKLYPSTQVLYASKAYINPALARLFQEEGLGLDVVSGGELAIALAAGFPPERIHLHGNNKTPEELREAVAAGIGRVVVAVEDPDPHVRGRGVRALRAAGVEVDVGLCEGEVREQLAPYLKHRATGRPWVVLKLAATLDGRTAAPDGSSRWITGPEARLDAHRLRAESDAILVGAGTVRVDDPKLTVREIDADGREPLRVVLGRAPDGARVRPALELEGDLVAVLDDLGGRGVLQVLVEGGATVAGGFHRAGLVDRYVLYVSPTLLGGDDGHPVLAGPGAATLATAWRGKLVGVQRLGDDVRIDVAPAEGR